MPSSQTTSMPYVRLGQSGLRVSRLILGCMSYGSPDWMPWALPEKEALEHIKAAYDAGINTFATANAYSNGLSEVILGRAIKKYQLPRENIIVMTKLYSSDPNETGFLPAGIEQQTQQGLSRKRIFEAVQQSLKRLQLDYVDVFQCHRFDNETPIAETMQALHDIVTAGYARYIGMSSCWAWQFHAMQNYAIQNHLTPFVSMQDQYNLVDREEEREVFPTLKLFGVGSLPWCPLAREMLNRTSADAGERVSKSERSFQNEFNCQIAQRVETIAKSRGISMAQVALAWTMRKEVSAPIIGSTSLDNLKDLIGAVHVNLTAEEIRYLEEPYEPQRAFSRS